MSRGRAWITRHIPHQDGMCLLDEVMAWDGETITCATRTHLDPANPLRARGLLPAVSGIEYAAQSMALHGALLAGHATAPGYLASVRDVRLHVDRLDDLPGALRVRSRRLSGDEVTILYQFDLDAQERALLSGRAAVVLDVGRLRNRVI
ncbi:MAG: 3-hydroxylacyl-ACP dehydratase [Proteobacteria bacterium]|nr:3-hydroxylacyl-ACP dehydratase [Pseudomonadota bacterium]